MNESRRTRLRRSGRWIPEGILVLLSAALGFGAASYGQSRDDRRVAAHVLSSIEAEVAHNLASLEPMVPFHREWERALTAPDASSGSTGIDVWFSTRPAFPPGVETPFPVLRRSAWDAAVAGGSLRLLEYDVVAALSEIYRMQETVTENIGRLASGPLAQATTYDPVSRDPSARLLWLTLADIHAAEAMLIELYHEHSAILRAALRR